MTKTVELTLVLDGTVNNKTLDQPEGNHTNPARVFDSLQAENQGT